MSIEITMPRLSDTMESGTIISWHVNEGDEVSAGDVLADIETDKATMEMQSFDDGRMAKILIAAGESAQIGTLIAVLAEEDEDAGAVAAQPVAAAKVAPVASPAPGAPETSTPAAAPPPAAPAASTPPAAAPAAPAAPAGARPTGERMRITPVARRLADDHGIDVHTLAGSGPQGRITKKDVLAAAAAMSEMAASVAPSAAASATAAVSAPGTPIVSAVAVTNTAVPTTRVPLAATMQGAGSMLTERSEPVSNMRRIIAQRLVEAKTTIPHYQVTMTFNMDPLLGMRSALNEQLAPMGVKLSVNDFIVRCCALAMYEHPMMNASWGGDSILYHGQVNIGVAISLPAERGGGLLVATIRDSDVKSLRAISAETHALAEKARTRGLAPEEMSDTTFTISNLGMFGVEHFTAIINPPNSAILACGAAVKKPVVRDDEIVVGSEMQATLSLDHRVIDGATAAAYMKTLKTLIENPAAVLV